MNRSTKTTDRGSRTLAFLLTLLLVFVPQTPVQAQSAELNAAYQSYQGLEKEGRYEEAVPFALEVVRLAEEEFGLEHSNVALSLSNLAGLYLKQGRYAAVEPLLKRSLAIFEEALGPEHPNVAISLSNLASLYNDQSRYAEALPLFQRALAIQETVLGSDHLDVTPILSNLVQLYYHQGRYAEALPLSQRALAIRETVLGPDHPDVATALNNLAGLYPKQGRYAAAEPLFERALAIRETVLGPDHPDVAISLNNLAELYRKQARYAAAEPLFERALVIKVTTLGPVHPGVALSLSNLALLYKTQGRYAEAESFYQRALAIEEKARGPDHPQVARVLNNLAELYRKQGRYAEAEPLFQRTLGIRETALGPAHPDVATTLGNLALLYNEQGRYAEAEPLLERALAIYEKAMGPDHPDVATALNNLAGLYLKQGRYAEALPLFQRALAIRENALGAAHPDMAANHTNLAGLYRAQRRYAEALPLFQRALAIRETALGPENPDTGIALNNLALLFNDQGHSAEAEPLYQRSLAIDKAALGPDHPVVAATFSNLALLYNDQGRYTEALDSSRKNVNILRRRFVGDAVEESVGLLSEQHDARYGFIQHVELTLHPEQVGERSALESEAFESVQLARTSSAASAVTRMAARFASGNTAISDLLRRQQDTQAQLVALDKTLLDLLGQPSAQQSLAAKQELRAQIEGLQVTLTALDTDIKEQFPRYAELIRRDPLSVSQTQALLGESEALLTFVRSFEGTTHVFVIRAKGQQVYTVDYANDVLKDDVAALRAGTEVDYVVGEPLPFDTKLAHSMYTRLLEPAEAILDGIEHLFVVPHGPLESLPLSVLVTDDPSGVAYPDTAWLIHRYAMTTLPSVGSLNALRAFAKATEATAPFIGFGDPVLEGETQRAKGMTMASAFRGVIADVDKVRQLPRLPDTAEELYRMAETLGASREMVYVQGRASESNVKETLLYESKVVAFSTHGLISGELKDLVEPALVLTPPLVGTEDDDGLLTASEIAQLRFDADWVVLSACNTAAGDEPGATGLSGLAKAFFYAGARALLVSHWPVESEATTALTTRLFETLKATPSLGRAEALRRSMQGLLQTERTSHPIFWAPFLLVGEGAG